MVFTTPIMFRCSIKYAGIDKPFKDESQVAGLKDASMPLGQLTRINVQISQNLRPCEGCSGGDASPTKHCCSSDCPRFRPLTNHQSSMSQLNRTRYGIRGEWSCWLSKCANYDRRSTRASELESQHPFPYEHGSHQ